MAKNKFKYIPPQGYEYGGSDFGSSPDISGTAYGSDTGFSDQGQQYGKARKKRFSLKTLLVIILAVTLAAEGVVAGLWFPGFFRGPEVIPVMTEEDQNGIELSAAGASKIVFDKSEDIVPETAIVNADNRTAEFESGVKVSFGELCLWDDLQEVEVRSLGKSSDDEYKAVGYDFTMDGGPEEFCGLVEVTVPYDKSWGNDVFVQYLNEDTGAWEIIYAQPNGDGTVTFRTDHFCTFGVFVDEVKNGSGHLSESVLEEVPGIDDLHTKVKVNWEALAARIREGKLQSDAQLTDLTSKGDAYFVDRSVSVISNSVTGMDYISKAANLPGISKVLGPLGQTITVGKFFYDGHQKGWNKAFQDNKWDLLATSVGALSTLPPPAGPICAGVSVAYFVTSATYKTAEDINNGGQDSVAELAYREFTKNFVWYNPKDGDCMANYNTALAYEKRSDLGKFFADPLAGYTGNLEEFLKKKQGKITDKKTGKVINDDYFSMPCGGSDYLSSNWKTVFENAKALQKSGKMKAGDYIDKVIDNYVYAFWKMDDDMRREYLENTDYGNIFMSRMIKGYKHPTKEKIEEYATNMKNDIYGWLKPYMEEMLEQEFYSSLNSIYSKFLELEQAMNATYQIELLDNTVEYFSSSEYASHPIGLSISDKGEVQFVNRWFIGKTCSIEFTGAVWMKYGCPKMLRILGKKGDVWNFKYNYLTRELDLKPGHNTVILKGEDNSDDAVWELESLVYKSHYHYEYKAPAGLSEVERIKHGLFAVKRQDTTVTATPESYEYTDIVEGGAPGTAGNYHGGHDLPGAVGSREELIQRMNSIQYQANIQITPSANEPFTSREKIRSASLSFPDERLYIKYSYVLLVYRPARRGSASQNAWQHIDENAASYWDRVILHKTESTE